MGNSFLSSLESKTEGHENMIYLPQSTEGNAQFPSDRMQLVERRSRDMMQVNFSAIAG